MTASHTDTLGDLVLHITAASADPIDLRDEGAGLLADGSPRCGRLSRGGEIVARHLRRLQFKVQTPELKLNVTVVRVVEEQPLESADRRLVILERDGDSTQLMVSRWLLALPRSALELQMDGAAFFGQSLRIQWR